MFQTVGYRVSFTVLYLQNAHKINFFMSLLFPQSLILLKYLFLENELYGVQS